jgi:5-methylcytosine-specific restriction endonuclease McrA
MKRSELFARDGYACVYCGRSAPEVELTVDHVEPRRLGGDNSSGNLVTACRTCNRDKGGKAAWAWLADRPDERAHFLEHATRIWPRLRAAILEAASK